MLLPKFRRYGLTPAQEQRRDERALERVRKILRMRRSSVRSVVSLPELVAALDAAEQAELPRQDEVERVALEDRTLIGGVPSEYVFEQALERSPYPDPETLMLVAEQAPLYHGDYVEDTVSEESEP